MTRDVFRAANQSSWVNSSTLGDGPTNSLNKYNGTLVHR